MYNQLIVARHKTTQKLIAINDLKPSQRGLKCDCYCEACKGELQARMGHMRTWHFAHHQPTQSLMRCTQTHLHNLGKWVLSQMKTIELKPFVLADRLTERDRLGRLIQYHDADLKPFKIKIQSCVLEKRLSLDDHQALVADVVAEIEHQAQTLDMIFEIKVTHGVDAIKRAKIQTLDFLTVEIDLSSLLKVKSLTIGAVEQAILDTNHHHIWLSDLFIETAFQQTLVHYNEFDC